MLRIGATALVTIMVLTACSSSPAGTPGPGATQAPVNVPPVSITPDVPLEDLFPDEIGGRPLDVESATGQSVFTLFDATEPEGVNQFLSQMGSSIDQMSV